MTPGYSLEELRAQFPILQRQVNDKDLVYLDNAATTQKPERVIQKIDHYYRATNANVHRGVHLLSQEATAAQDEARRTVQKFLNAQHQEEIIFVRGTTEAINLVAQSWGGAHIGAGDEILLTGMEHHSNIVPWQMLAERVGASIKVVPITDSGEIEIERFHQSITDRTKLVSVVHVSNALGTINPVAEVVAIAHGFGIPVLLDGAQAVAHMTVDVQALGCDFYAFSGHKIYGPTGIGVLYGRKALLEEMPPWQGGGDMILSVSFEKTEFNTLPYKFEAGTPDIAGAIGLGEAIDFVKEVGLDAIGVHESRLLSYAEEQIAPLQGIKRFGTGPRRAGVLSLTMDGVHPHDIGTILDHEGIAIRAGHHCAQPVMERFGIPATARASFGLYNSYADVDRFVVGLGKVKELFG